MTLSAVSSSTDVTGAATSSTSTSNLGLDTTDFLQLMIEQLQNQNPTEPTDTSAFMDQMIQLSNYDMQVANNETLTELSNSVNSMISSNGLGYMGHEITAPGNTTTLQDGSAQWSYSLGTEASDVTLNVLDQDGNVVYSQAGETGAGTHDFTWDGMTDDGQQMEDGSYYTLSIEATDSDGNEVATGTAITGTVTGVDSSSGETYLTIGDVGVAMDSVLNITAN